MSPDLISEVEAAEEPSRDLWQRAEKACFPEGRSGVIGHLFQCQIECGAWIDSALSLLPEGLCPSVGQNVHHLYWHAYALKVEDGEPVTVAEGQSVHDGGLAALAMVLRARV